MQQFYIAQDGQAIGPVTVDDANRMARDGTIDSTTLVWDDQTNWISVSDHPVLSRVFATITVNAEGKSRFEIVGDPVVSANDASRESAAADQLLEERRAEERRAEKLSQEITSREQKVSQLTDQLAALEKSAQDAVTRREEAAAQLTEQAAALDRLHASAALDAASAEKELKAAKAECDAIKRERQSETQEAVELSKKNAALQAAAAEAGRQLEAAQQRARLVEARLTELSAQEKQLKDETLSSAGALADTRRELEKLAPLASELALMRSAHAAARAAAAHELKEERDELESLREQRAAYDAEIGLISEKLVGIRLETADLEEKRIEAQAMLGREVASAFDDIRRTIAELGTMTAEWQAARTGDDEARRQGLEVVRDLMQSLSERETALSDAMTRVGDRAAAEALRDAAEAATAVARDQLVAVRDQLKSLTALCWQETQRLESARAERVILSDDATARETELAELTDKRQAEEELLTSALTAAAAAGVELGAARLELETLRRERGQHEEAVADLGRMRAGAMEAYLQLERDLANASLRASEAARREGESGERAATLDRDAAARREEIATLEARREELVLERDAVAASVVALAEDAKLKRAAAEQELSREARALHELRLEADGARAASARMAMDAEEAQCRATEAREKLRVCEERQRQVNVELARLDECRAAADLELAARHDQLSQLVSEEAAHAERLRRQADELAGLEDHRSGIEAQEKLIMGRIQALDAEMVMMERERAARARADLVDLRSLLKAREEQEKNHIEKLLQEGRSEFRSLQDDWATEEKQGITNDELRKLRHEVEEKRRELAKAERQVAAMRAGLAKLREENGRNLLRRIQSFESQQLEDVRRRLVESRSEAESLEMDWASETKSAELIDKQVIEVKAAFEKR